MCKEYNGWSNYPTWVTTLWIDNDEGLSAEVQSMAEEYYQDDKPAYKFGDWLKEYILDLVPEVNQANLTADLLGFALDLVNWQEIAEGYYSDLKSNEESEDES